MENKLFTYINNEIEKRGWSYRELAKHSELSQSAISLTINGQRGISLNFCKSIAKGLNEPEEKIMKLAGILPTTEKQTEEEKELLHHFRNLSSYDKNIILKMTKLLENEK